MIQFLANGLINGFAYAPVALGFALIYNTTRIFHFAHGAVYTLSAYIFYALYKILNIPFSMSVFLTLVVAGIAGVGLNEIVYAPLTKRNASLFTKMLSSIGLYIVIVNIIAVIFQSDTKILNPEVHSTYLLGPLVLTMIQITSIVVFLMIFGSLTLSLRKTNLGKVIRAMRDNPDLVSAMGINPENTVRIVFALGSVLAATSAILIGLDQGIDPHIGLAAFLNGAVAVIIGGVGHFEGAALGAIVVGILQSLAAWNLSTRWQDLVTFLLLITFLLFRVEGILGGNRRTEESKL
jgi:branched-subunit amino acid ABC-type transport system permease component